MALFAHPVGRDQNPCFCSAWQLRV